MNWQMLALIATPSGRGLSTVLTVGTCLCGVLFAQMGYGQVRVIYSDPFNPAQDVELETLFSTDSAATESVAVEATTSDASTSSTATATALAQAEQARKAKRMQQLQRLVFDRRPSTILRVWSARDEEAPSDESFDGAAEPTPAEDTPQPAADNTNEAASSEPTPPAPELTEDQLEEQEFQEEVKGLQRHVTLGHWEEVRAILSKWNDDEAKMAYQQMLMAIATGRTSAANAQNQNQQAANRQAKEKNKLASDDVLGLALASPEALSRSQLAQLGTVLQHAIESGTVIEEFVAELEKIAVPDPPKTSPPSGTAGTTNNDAGMNDAGIAEKTESADPSVRPQITHREALRVLVAAGYTLKAKPFLPPLDVAQATEDHEGLNLLSQYYLAQYEDEKKVSHLEDAWRVTQAVLAAKGVDNVDRQESLTRAVELAPRVREELGLEWLKSSFTESPERGMEIIAAIGGKASTGMQNQPFNPEFRLKMLELQNTAVEALLDASRDRAESWRDTLAVLASSWLTEAKFAYEVDESRSRGPSMERDAYGNLYYVDRTSTFNAGRVQQGQGRPITSGELLELVPSDAWLSFVDHDVRPQFERVVAQLFLKVGEEDKALPYIERLAHSHPDLAKALVDDFLQVWTNNHDPNANRNRTNYYIYMYGYERKAEGIPLTRSKQERNLQELSALIKRLRALPLGELNEPLLARAFTTCHSSAEVYELTALERVFGSVSDMKPATVAALAQQMRTNLNSVWRDPSVQKDAKTRRKQKDLEAEVLRGYNVARLAIEDSLKKNPEDWALVLAKATLHHDENNYKHELEKSSTFTKRREGAFGDFEAAAELYAKQVANLDEDKQSTQVYELWYYASLGACDLGNIKHEHQADLTQPARIREAIMRLPGEAAEKHLAMFANTMFTRMSSVNPAVKFRYLKTGFEIVGEDHKQAIEAKKVYDYYKDLVTEIKLETALDGPTTVGHRRPFGVFVNLHHTNEIERESGGFSRYLQNQNNQTYSYNYGRPTENYRDKFEESVRAALGEHFDVLSVTFQAEDVHSRALSEYGWRYTPYAYLLLQARGPEVDSLPSIQLDLDFLDTSGYAVLPIESPPIAIDAGGDSEHARPFQQLNLVQTLDERQSQKMAS